MLEFYTSLLKKQVDFIKCLCLQKIDGKRNIKRMSQLENPEFPPFDPGEMRQYGFDPAKEADRLEWLETTPGELPAHDYSHDAFEFSSPNPTAES